MSNLQTRRQFFKKSINAILPLMMVFGGNSIIPLHAFGSNNCQNSCSHSCEGDCAGTCHWSCAVRCRNGCMDYCAGTSNMKTDTICNYINDTIK